MKQYLAVLLAALVAAPAAAQQAKPSFDCAKTATAHERAICGNPELSTADRELATAYAALAGRLAGAARMHLETSQRRWIANWRGCDGNPPGLVDCLKGRYAARMEEFKLFVTGPYPFISDQAIVASGRGYSVDAAYPQFDDTSADFGTLNRRFAESTRQDVDSFLGSPDGTFEQTFDLHRPAPSLMSILVRRIWWSAHVVVSLEGTLVDLRTGRPVGLDEIFLARSGLETAIAAAVRKEFADNGRGAPPDDLAGQIGTLEAANFAFEADGVSVMLPELALALGMKAYLVDIPYADLKPLIRPDGPLAQLR
jgi:uncharacterized protein